MEPFEAAIRLRMVGRRLKVSDSEAFGGESKMSAEKLFAVVGQDEVGAASFSDDVLEEGEGVRLLVRFRCAGEGPVDAVIDIG